MTDPGAGPPTVEVVAGLDEGDRIILSDLPTVQDSDRIKLE